MGIEVLSPDASRAERKRALAAALAVFRANGIQPEGAALGKEEINLFESRGRRGPAPKEEAYRAAAIFDKASAAAFDAGGGRWNAMLHVMIDEESQWGEYIKRSPVHQWKDPNDEGRLAN